MTTPPIHLDPEIFKTTGLCIPEGATFEQWQLMGNGLKAIDQRMMWFLGDWLNFGEAKYGEMYAQVIEGTHYDINTLKNAKWVCSRIERSRRRDNLSFSHHQEVAPLEPADQDKFLEIAGVRCLSRKSLRVIIKGKQPEPEPLKRLRIEVLKDDFVWLKEGGDFKVTFGCNLEQVDWKMKLKAE